MDKQQRLIDANALQRCVIEVTNEKGTYTIHAFLETTIQNAPTIDAVPVVRCWECRFRGNPLICPMCHEEEYYEEDYGFDNIVRDKTFDNWYCPKGEREDDNDP